MVVVKELLDRALFGLWFIVPPILFAIYWKYRFIIKERWILFFGNKKHLIKVHFFNKQGCITTYLKNIKSQKGFTDNGEYYELDANAIWHESHGHFMKKSKEYVSRVNILLREKTDELLKIENKILKFEDEFKIKTNKYKLKLLDKIEKLSKGKLSKRKQKAVVKANEQLEKITKEYNLLKTTNLKYKQLRDKKFKILKDLKTLEHEIDDINILSTGSGMPNLMYIDGNTKPITRKALMNIFKEKSVKWNAYTIQKKMDEKYLIDLMTAKDTNRILFILLVVSVLLNLAILGNMLFNTVGGAK